MRLKSSDSATQEQYSDKALDYLQKYANSITSKDAETFTQIADALKASRKYGAAGDWYQKAVDIMIANKETPSALDYYNVGLNYYYGAITAKPADQDMLTKADEAFGKLIEVKPDLGSGYYWRGMSNYAKDQQAQEGLAKPYFDKYIEISGNDPKTSKSTLINAYTYELLYYYYKEDKDNIKVYADKLAGVDPNNVTVKEITENMAAREKAAKPAQNKK
jgi:tetratricopeptide (TPR) repeat protein